MSLGLTRLIGRQLEGFHHEVTRTTISEFASAVGETDPLYFDVSAAHAAGFEDIPAPPTFLISLEIDHRDSLRFLRELGFDTAMVLHGQQTFLFRFPVCAGDPIDVQREITDAGVKGQGMTYIVTLNTFRRRDQIVATSECIWLIMDSEED